MTESRVKRSKVKDLDLLPIMNLFSILIPFMLSVAVFERIGILELNLPERSMTENTAPADIDDGLLNLSVIVTGNKITVGAAAGFQPDIYYQEEVQYRSKSDKQVFRKVYLKGEQVHSPSDRKLMTPSEKDVIFLHAVAKKDSADPGAFSTVAVNVDGDALLDQQGNWFTRLPNAGEAYRLIGDEAMRKMDAGTLTYCKLERLSAYQELAKQLEQIHRLYSAREDVPTDVDNVIILAQDDVIYDKIIQVMDAAKSAGYTNVSLSLMGGDA